MKKFEYKVIEIPFNGWSGKPKINVETTLNQLGSQGWELVLRGQTIDGATPSLIFKREIIST